MDDISFGKKLRELRINSKKTVHELSAYLTSIGFKAATQTIYGWERGHSQPTADTIMAICEFYGIKDILHAFGYKSGSSITEESPSTADKNDNALAQDERQLIEDYRTLNDQGQEYIRQTMYMATQIYKKMPDLSSVEKQA